MTNEDRTGVEPIGTHSLWNHPEIGCTLYIQHALKNINEI